jgi:hypothetical protein
MFKSIWRRVLVLLLCLLILPNTPARATDTLSHDVHGIEAGVIAISAAIVVVVVVLVVHYKPSSIKGCVASGPNGLELTNSSDKVVYQLGGATTDIKPGDLVKVKRKKKSAKGSTPPTFSVKELGKDYGACPATP